MRTEFTGRLVSKWERTGRNLSNFAHRHTDASILVVRINNQTALVNRITGRLSVQIVLILNINHLELCNTAETSNTLYAVEHKLEKVVFRCVVVWLLLGKITRVYLSNMNHKQSYYKIRIRNRITLQCYKMINDTQRQTWKPNTSRHV